MEMHSTKPHSLHKIRSDSLQSLTTRYRTLEFQTLIWEGSYNMFSAVILAPKRFDHYEDLYRLLQDPSNVFKLEKKEEASLCCWLPQTRMIDEDARQAKKAPPISLLRFFDAPPDFKLT
jgi:hypothetical protein